MARTFVNRIILGRNIELSRFIFYSREFYFVSNRYDIPRMRRNAVSVNEVRCQTRHIQSVEKFRKSSCVRKVDGQ